MKVFYEQQFHHWFLYFMHKGVSRFSVENFWSHSTEKSRWGALLCLKKIFHRKNWCIGGGGASRFCRIFLSNRTEKIRWGTLRCFKNFGVSKNFMHKKGYHNFPSKNFGLTGPKNFLFQKIWGIELFLCIIGGVTFFRQIFLVSQCRKTSWASLQCFRKFGVSNYFYA